MWPRLELLKLTNAINTKSNAPITNDSHGVESVCNLSMSSCAKQAALANRTQTQLTKLKRLKTMRASYESWAGL